MLFKYTMMFTLSPVEAHALYDGQLVPARDWSLLLTGFCCKDSTQFKEPWYCLLDVLWKCYVAFTFFTVFTAHHSGRTVAVCLCFRLKWVQNDYICHWNKLDIKFIVLTGTGRAAGRFTHLSAHLVVERIIQVSQTGKKQIKSFKSSSQSTVDFPLLLKN